ncbi:MAG: hydroxymethylglutaryl-CoA reductase, degradative [bacterium]
MTTKPTSQSRSLRVKTGKNGSSRIPGFYRLSVEQRLALLARDYGLTEHEIGLLRSGTALKIDQAVNMVENAIGVLGLPLGVVPNYLVDGREYLIPMAIEEASVIAAASKAGRLIHRAGGFTTLVDEPVMIGQIQLVQIDQAEEAKAKILGDKTEILRLANDAIPRMVARGGGAIDLDVRILDGGPGVNAMAIVNLLFDVREAMGANTVNHACEAVAAHIGRLTGGRVNLKILSNLADRRLARAEFKLPFDKLADGRLSGREVAQRLVEASRFAWVDPYRAATHNKGIFNGLCAAALSLGQDWRAIEAGGHAYAAHDGQYRSLATFEIEDKHLHGKIELPLQVGLVGGAVDVHPGFRILRKVCGVSSTRDLAGVLASVGLGQCFAACLALCTDGIQKGHMALHARSVALSVGVPPNEVDRVASEMIRRGQVRAAVAESILNEADGYRARTRSGPAPLAEAFATGKVVLFGEHAVVYNQPGITTTIQPGLRVRILPDPDGPRFLTPHFQQVFTLPSGNPDFSVFSKAAVVAMKRYGVDKDPIAIDIESELVPGMGLGSSAAFSVALCRALRQYKHMESGRQWQNGMFNDVQHLESFFHGNPSGVDAATILSGGVLWFRKGPPREIVPMRLASQVSGIVCVVEPGASTRELVEEVRRRHDQDPERVGAIVRDIGEITVDAGIALGAGDLADAGGLMFRNHELLVKLGVSTPGLDDAVKLLLDRGVLGAKLTGSGGGGAVVALVNPEDQHRLVTEMAEEFPLVFPFFLEASL